MKLELAPLDPLHDALLVIDMQNDFTPGGSLAVTGGDTIIPGINQLARRFSHVIATQDWHPLRHISFAITHGEQPFGTIEAPYGKQTLWPAHCVQNTPGADLHPALTIAPQLILRKGFREDIDSYSAFLENDHTTPTGLAGYLDELNLRRLFLCGLAFDYCVGSSAEDGAELGFECYVLEDLTRSIDATTHRAMQERLQVAGATMLQSASLL